MEIAEAERSARLAAQLEARAGGKVEAGRIARRDRPAAFAIVALAQRPRDEKGDTRAQRIFADRSAEHTSALQSLMRIPSAGLCLQKKYKEDNTHTIQISNT